MKHTENKKNSFAVIALLFKSLKLQAVLGMLFVVFALLKQGLEFILANETNIVLEYLNVAKNEVGAFSILTLLFIVALLGWDWSERFGVDHWQNLYLSMYYTWFLRRYLQQEDNQGVLNLNNSMKSKSVHDFNRIIQKVMIDYHDDYVLVRMEIMKTAESEKIYKANKEEIQLFFSDYFPDYIFSDAVRDNNQIWYSGTRVTR